jgi:exonuclease VII small subunit
VQATETMVEGIDNAGVPDTEQGRAAAEDVSVWAERALDDLEEAQDSLDEEADSLEEAIDQFKNATGAIGGALVTGTQTLTNAAQRDPALAAAFRVTSTCQQLREERGAR